MGEILAQQQPNTTTYLQTAAQVPAYSGFYKDMMFFTLRSIYYYSKVYCQY